MSNAYGSLNLCLSMGLSNPLEYQVSEDWHVSKALDSVVILCLSKISRFTHDVIRGFRLIIFLPANSPVAAPTLAPSALPSAEPALLPSRTSMPSAQCVLFGVTLTDTGGNGFQDNYLNIDNISLTLESGASEAFALCLPPGIYSPYCCGGSNPLQSRWAVYDGDGTPLLRGGCGPTCTSPGDFTLYWSPSASPTTTPEPSMTPTTYQPSIEGTNMDQC